MFGSNSFKRPSKLSQLAMDETVFASDFSHQYEESNFPLDPGQENFDLNLADSLLGLDAEDLTEIYHMVSDWESNFGSIEGADEEDLLRLVQIESLAHLYQHPASSNGPNSTQQLTEKNPESSNGLHDRLPSYYTALAPSRTAPWIPPATQQVYNKLPAYITDQPGTSDGSKPGKKKLNLAEYRTRREKELKLVKQEQPEEETQQVKLENESSPEEQVQAADIEIENKEPEVNKGETDDVKHAPNSTKREISRSPVRRYSRSSSSSSSSSSDSPPNSPLQSRERRRRHRSSSGSRTSYSSRSRSRSPGRSYSSRNRTDSRRSVWSSSSRQKSERRSSRRRSTSRHRRSTRSRSRSCSSWRAGARRKAARSPCGRKSHYDGWKNDKAERQQAIEERRVIYVGKLGEGTSRRELRRRFEIFGPVADISLHFRERGDNYGFVTFEYKVDAYAAVEHGNDDPHLPQYDLSFGGRRAFCQETYADLDAVDDDSRSKANDVDFETLLRVVKAQLHRRPGSDS